MEELRQLAETTNNPQSIAQALQTLILQEIGDLEALLGTLEDLAEGLNELTGATVTATQRVVTDLIEEYTTGEGVRVVDAKLDYTAVGKGQFRGIATMAFGLPVTASAANPILGWVASDPLGQGPGLGGTIVTVTNGIFSFSSTGYWRVEVQLGGNPNANSEIFLYASTNNGGNWIVVDYVEENQAETRTRASMTALIKVSETSGANACLVKVGSLGFATLANYSLAIFTKYADL